MKCLNILIVPTQCSIQWLSDLFVAAENWLDWNEQFNFVCVTDARPDSQTAAESDNNTHEFNYKWNTRMVMEKHTSQWTEAADIHTKLNTCISLCIADDKTIRSRPKYVIQVYDPLGHCMSILCIYLRGRRLAATAFVFRTCRIVAVFYFPSKPFNNRNHFSSARFDWCLILKMLQASSYLFDIPHQSRLSVSIFHSYWPPSFLCHLTID